jgi:hypothetical protein
VNSNKFEIICYVVGTPRTPTNFTLVSSTDTSIVIEWIPGYNGGDEQTFNIQYCISNESKIWTTQEIPKYNRQTYILVGLQGDTLYTLRMFAENKFDISRVTYIQSISTMPAVEKGIYLEYLYFVLFKIKAFIQQLEGGRCRHNISERLIRIILILS